MFRRMKNKTEKKEIKIENEKRNDLLGMMSN